MFQKIRKNKFFRKALVFASVFLILATTLVFPCFAQASQNNNTYLVDGQYWEIYVYNSGTTDLLFQISAKTNYATQSFTFFENYYNSDLFANNVDDALINLSLNGNFDLRFVRTTISSGSVTYSTGVRSNLDWEGLANYLSVMNNNVAYMNQRFVSSYNLQFSQFNELNQSAEVLRSEGYTRALNDYNAFKKGLFDIFNAPFVFVQNLTGFEIFGITIFDIFAFFILLFLGIFIFLIIRKVIF